MKNIYEKVLLSLALILFLGSSAAAQRIISGNISDAEDGEPRICRTNG